jgi:hypothetical protein
MIASGDATTPLGGLQKIRFVDVVCGFRARTDQKSSERPNAFADLEGTDSGGEFVVCWARETLRYANTTSKSGALVYFILSALRTESFQVLARRSSFVQGASSN